MHQTRLPSHSFFSNILSLVLSESWLNMNYLFNRNRTRPRIDGHLIIAMNLNHWLRMVRRWVSIWRCFSFRRNDSIAVNFVIIDDVSSSKRRGRVTDPLWENEGNVWSLWDLKPRHLCSELRRYMLIFNAHYADWSVPLTDEIINLRHGALRSVVIGYHHNSYLLE